MTSPSVGASIFLLVVFLIPKIWSLTTFAKSEGSVFKENIMLVERRSAKNRLLKTSSNLHLFERFLLLIPLYWKTIIVFYILVPFIMVIVLYNTFKGEEFLKDDPREILFLDFQNATLREDFLSSALGLWVSLYFFALSGTTFVLHSLIGIAERFKILFSLLPLSCGPNIYQDGLYLSFVSLLIVIIMVAITHGNEVFFEDQILEPLLRLMVFQILILSRSVGSFIFVTCDKVAYESSKFHVLLLTSIHYLGVYYYVLNLPIFPQLIILRTWGSSSLVGFLLFLVQLQVIRVSPIPVATDSEDLSENYGERLWSSPREFNFHSDMTANIVSLKQLSLYKKQEGYISVTLGQYRWIYTMNILRQLPRFLTITSNLSEDSTHLVDALYLERQLPKDRVSSIFSYLGKQKYIGTPATCGVFLLGVHTYLITFVLQSVVFMVSYTIVALTSEVNCTKESDNFYRALLAPPTVRSHRHLYVSSRDHILFLVTDDGIEGGYAYLKEYIKASVVYDVETKVTFIFDISEFESLVLFALLVRKFKSECTDSEWALLEGIIPSNDFLCYFFYTGRERTLSFLMGALRDKYPGDAPLIESVIIQRVHNSVSSLRMEEIFRNCTNKKLTIATIGSENSSRMSRIYSRRVKKYFASVSTYHSVVPRGVQYL